MNLPNVFGKAVEGFITPPRTYLEKVLSAGRGAVAMLDKTNRQEFIDKLDNGTINEGVISQASTGPMLMLSLFHDLQNPLFKRYKFDATEFLQGVGPALERFHSVHGGLENQLRKMQEDAIKDDKMSKKSEAATENAADGKTSEDESSPGYEPFVRFSSSSTPEQFLVELNGKNLHALMEHDWSDEAIKDPDSLAAQLSRMVTEELLNIFEIRAKGRLMFEPDLKLSFKSCKVNNVALLSARSFHCVMKDNGEDFDQRVKTDLKYEIIDHDIDEAELKKRKGGVAAQVEVLYDVTKEYVKTNPVEGSNAEALRTEDVEANMVSVAVVQGWLHGGPDDELRWRLALLRPAFEFPGYQQYFGDIP